MRLIELLKQKQLKISTVESCTGGLVAGAITSIPGASEVFHMGLVTYSNEAKHRLVGVSEETLAQHTAVSRETALEMTAGGRKVSGAELCIAVTGYAGPGGEQAGLVYVAVNEVCECFHFAGNREIVRNQAVREALRMAEEYLVKNFC